MINWQGGEIANSVCKVQTSREDLQQIPSERFAPQSRSRNRANRAQLAEKAHGELEHLWVANKVNRIAEYQATAERMTELNTPRSHEIKISAMKAVAEELGDLPARTQVDITQTTVAYELVGISVEDI